MRKIEKFRRLPSPEKKLFLEAFFTLGTMRMSLLVLPFKRLVRPLEQRPDDKKPETLTEEQREKAAAVGRAIGRAAAHTPWESACLVQALTAQRMLQRRGVPGRFVLGVEKSVEMSAHAWTRCGDLFVTGAAGHERFTVLSAFFWRGDNA